VYLFHHVPDARDPRADRRLALIVAAEAVVLEMACNLAFLALTGEYLFFYLPGDLWHLSSLQIVPFYFLSGLAIAKTLRRFRRDPAFFTVLSGLMAGVFVLGAGR
jgi:cytochrome c-type biogenesis protein CcmE